MLSDMARSQKQYCPNSVVPIILRKKSFTSLHRVLSLSSSACQSVSHSSERSKWKWAVSLVLHLLVHVENAQHAAQDGFLGLLGLDTVPDVAKSCAKVSSACREDSPEELCHWACQSATEEPDNQGPQQDENCWHAAWVRRAKKKSWRKKKGGEKRRAG